MGSNLCRLRTGGRERRGREVAGVAYDPCPVIVPCTIQDEILRVLSLPAWHAELLSQIHQMTTL